MKLARCIDDDGLTRWVEPTGASTGILCRGNDLFEGLETGDEEITVREWLAPLAPHTIFCVGLNYRAHAAETGAAIPQNPVLFMKPGTTVNAPGAPIRLPKACEQGPEVDFEAELAVIIGKTTRDVPIEEALGKVLGYTCANDVSARRWQKHGGGGQWIRGKSFDTFCPLGPVLVTADEIADPQDLAIRSELNHQQMQSSNTADMIFSVAELISFISRDTTLLPGTAILTGTPEGVGFARTPPRYLADGDLIEVTIQDIGTLGNPVQAG